MMADDRDIEFLGNGDDGPPASLKERFLWIEQKVVILWRAHRVLEDRRKYDEERKTEADALWQRRQRVITAAVTTLGLISGGYSLYITFFK
jgi:hypothetical protein